MSELKHTVPEPKHTDNEKGTAKSRKFLAYALPLAAGLAMGGYAYHKYAAPEMTEYNPRVIDRLMVSEAPRCDSVSNAYYSGMLLKDTATNVGELGFVYLGKSEDGAKISVSCPESGDNVVYFSILPSTDGLIRIPGYGKDLRIRVETASDEKAIVSVTVVSSGTD